MGHGLPIRRACDDEPVQCFQGAVRLVAEPHGQPVKQFGMRGCAAHFAKVVGRVAQSAPEVIVPHAVHDAAPEQRVAVIREPACERGAACGFLVQIRDGQRSFQTRQTSQRSGADEFRRLVRVAAREQVNRARERRGFVAAIRGKIARGGIDHLRYRQRGE